MSVVIETTIGDLTVDLFVDERPISCLNFLKLCRLKYYNYNLFHTIEQGFIAQTGDPSGAGDGGCSIWGVVEGPQKRFFEAESLPKIYHNSVGLLSLVGVGKRLVGSQFFFTLGEHLTSLDSTHCVIGEIVEGHEVLKQLNETIVDEKFRPYQDVRITHTVVLDDPFADPRGFRVPSRSPSPSAERLQNGRIAADEDINDTDGKTMEEIQEMLADREAKARATILEIVGDLPSADMAPPENVLFVCKLNPITNDDDLEIIFSRFGKVKSCEVIRDKKSGESLQYAFVEFEDKKACETAYFKMDNVLIDDRRIHVDFSQSVAKVKWLGKGRGVKGDKNSLDFDNLRAKSTHSGKCKHDSERKNKQVEKKRNHNTRAKSRSRSPRRLSEVQKYNSGQRRHVFPEGSTTSKYSSSSRSHHKERSEDYRFSYCHESKYTAEERTERYHQVRHRSDYSQINIHNKTRKSRKNTPSPKRNNRTIRSKRNRSSSESSKSSDSSSQDSESTKSTTSSASSGHERRKSKKSKKNLKHKKQKKTKKHK